MSRQCKALRAQERAVGSSSFQIGIRLFRKPAVRRIFIGSKSFEPRKSKPPVICQAIYATSTTSFGLTQVTGVGESTEPSTVGVFFSIFESLLLRSSSVLLENPPPTFPMCCSFPSSSYAARISDPKVGTRAPSPSLKPTITQSVVLTCFILIQ